MIVDEVKERLTQKLSAIDTTVRIEERNSKLATGKSKLKWLDWVELQCAGAHWAKSETCSPKPILSLGSLGLLLQFADFKRDLMLSTLSMAHQYVLGRFKVYNGLLIFPLHEYQLFSPFEASPSATGCIVNHLRRWSHPNTSQTPNLPNRLSSFNPESTYK